MISFPQFIRSRRKSRNTPTGGFVGDAREDQDLPDVKTWSELENYLVSCGACDEALHAAQIWWRRYQIYNRTH